MGRAWGDGRAVRVREGVSAGRWSVAFEFCAGLTDPTAVTHLYAVSHPDPGSKVRAARRRPDRGALLTGASVHLTE